MPTMDSSQQPYMDANDLEQQIQENNGNQPTYSSPLRTTPFISDNDDNAQHADRSPTATPAGSNRMSTPSIEFQTPSQEHPPRSSPSNATAASSASSSLGAFSTSSAPEGTDIGVTTRQRDQTPPDLLDSNWFFPTHNQDDRRQAIEAHKEQLRQMRSVQVQTGQRRRLSSMRFFCQEFGTELKSLLQELIVYTRQKHWKKKVLTAVVSLCSLLVFCDLLAPRHDSWILKWLQDFILWMTTHPSQAVAAFVALFVVSTLAFIPPTILVFGAGYAFAQAIGFGWGVVAAILSCAIGSCIGAVIAFLRARYMMRDLIYLFSKRYPLVRAADRALKRSGFHIMILLRLCPLLPFNGLNYCCGITGVSLECFVMSLIGILPFQIFTVMVGATTGTLALRSAGPQGEYNSRQELGFIILIASGCAFGLIALVYIWKVVKQELRKELDLTPQELEDILNPVDTEASLQGGIESSVEVTHLDNSLSSSMQGEHGDYHRAKDDWLAKDEEWFWVWT